ncbi:HAD family hydrolase [Acutalibacter sp. 1XD8-36]|uniref:HAD family hydrolase n=1 Tax=Acutalibacter sp. 1XD8-36 TaxID=2320852 RepID=UPI0014125077|nr:HAD family hydrolase [Acutalibacter sp. 1XD8-36]NBJ88897.1 HAD family hydrolase [Acutalibacter sp. 1XD8-36]
MGKYKAVFFDRDGTLVRGDPEWTAFRNNCIKEWSGKNLNNSYDYFMEVFNRVLKGNFPFAPYHTVEEEMAFFKQWYLYVFDDLGITEKRSERADMLVEKLWYLKKLPYPETAEVLEYFKFKGYKLGVISDSAPSLEMTLLDCGLHKYFTSFTASSLVGAEKPDPIIFNAALEAQGVTAEESLYVDDYRPEAEGARKLGFTSFLLDRQGIEPEDQWTIGNLRELVNFVERNRR